jgi:hypothetical protein
MEIRSRMCHYSTDRAERVVKPNAVAWSIYKSVYSTGKQILYMAGDSNESANPCAQLSFNAVSLLAE